MTFQYFSKYLVYYAPIMLILEPKLSAAIQYFASKISISTEESVRLEALLMSHLSAFIPCQKCHPS